MKNKVHIVVILAVILSLLYGTKVHAAAIGMSISKTSAYVGDSFSVTISGINGYVNISCTSNISVSPSGNVWVDGQLSLSGKANATGTGKVTVAPVSSTSVTTSDVNADFITSASSRSITITEKPVEVTPPETSNQGSTNTGTSSTPKTNTNTQPKTNTKTQTNNNKKTTDLPEETIIPEEATPEFGIYGLTVKGIKENGEEQDISFSPTFNVDVFEYNLEVENEIVDLKLVTDAGPYSDYLKIEKPDKLQVGENEILLKLTNDEKDLTYKLKVIRKESPISVADTNDVDANMSVGVKTITMPVWLFTLTILSVIIIEAIILKWNQIGDFIKRRKK